MGHKVLLIEDDLTMLSLLKTLLSLEGYDVSVIDNEEKIEQMLVSILQENPSVVLSDVYLRHVNGFDLLRRIRREERMGKIRVIISSGMDFQERCKEEGADGFLLKPYTPEELIEKIGEVLSN